jgi:hypothetical protein
MRYRQLDSSGDYTAGRRAATFHQDSAEAVGQAVRTRLLLAEGEWVLDIFEGTPYAREILGANRTATADLAIKARILGTPGVVALVAYSSEINYNTRALAVRCTIDTAFGQSTVEASL